MIKSLLILACGATVALPSLAAVQSEVIDGLLINVVSSDGKYGIADEGSGEVFLINLETLEETYLYCDDWASLGGGNAVSNTGIVLGNIDEALNKAAYWEAGSWHLLPVQSIDTGTNYPQGITADGWRICGQIGRTAFGDTESLGQQPVYWERNEDGTYADYVELPYPETDFTGRVPQYVTAMYISDDGKTIAGQIVDWTGRYITPIIYQEEEKGKWNYKLLYDLNPDNIKLPDNPGFGPNNVDIHDYMTEAEEEAYEAAYQKYYDYVVSQPYLENYASDESMAAYLAAMDDFVNSGGNLPYPELQSFMTEEELANYQKAYDEWVANPVEYPNIDEFLSDEGYAEYRDALAKWESEYMEWIDKLSVYDDIFQSIVKGKPTFGFNDVQLSRNGRFYGTVNNTYNSTTYEPIYNPWIFDIDNDKTYIHDENDDLTLCSISNDGVLLAANPYMDYVRWAWISPTVDGTFVKLEDYMQIKDATLYEWMNEEMRHDYVLEEGYFDWDGNWIYNEVLVENAWLTGTPRGNADFSVIVTFEYNIWDLNSSSNFYSYILATQGLSGVKGLANESSLKINASKCGEITFSHSPVNVTVYDINGRLVYSAANPGLSVSTGLSNGLYIIKAVDANETVMMRKVVF